MRVCPKCGYNDPPEWRHSKFSSWIDIIDVGSFKELEPKLYQKLIAGEKVVEDKFYYYRITKTKAKVHRKAKIDFCGDWVEKQEKAAHQNIDFRTYWKLADPNQRRLLEEPAK